MWHLDKNTEIIRIYTPISISAQSQHKIIHENDSEMVDTQPDCNILFTRVDIFVSMNLVIIGSSYNLPRFRLKTIPGLFFS